MDLSPFASRVEGSPILGLDVGGAALKAADGLGRVLRQSFELWRAPDQLSAQFQVLAHSFPVPRRLAVTMTAELCDCFPTKADGVAAILGAVSGAFPDADSLVWQTTGRFVEPAEAILDPWATAASNWLALAHYAARWSEGLPSLLVDVGSTTTDVVPIRDGRPVPMGRSDPDRLASGELVYHGVERTPVCALAPAVTLAGRTYRTMAEWFATTRDVYLVLADLPEDPTDNRTADGRPATREHARDRLARVIGSDRSRFSPRDAIEVAQHVQRRQMEELGAAVEQVVAGALGGRVERVIASGAGEFLVQRLIARHASLRHTPVVSLSATLGPEISQAACAHAVAVLLAGTMFGSVCGQTEA